MKDVYDNPMLSMNARYLYLHFLRIGRVATVEELTTALPESEYAIKNAMKELKKFHYIKAVKYQTNGQWRTLLKFTDESLNVTIKNMLEIQPPTDEIPTVGKTPVLSVCNTSTSDMSISSNDKLEVLRTSNLGIHSEFREKGDDTMGWNLDGDEQPQSRSQARRMAIMDGEDIAGAVGKVEDRKAKLNAKYKPTRFEDVPASKHRSERPEESWTSADLVAEFYSLYREKCGEVPGQVNGQQFTVWINKQVGEGIERPVVLKAIRMFFNDPRLLADAGVGKPLWRKFIAYYYTVVGKVRDEKPVQYEDQEFLSHQEKMLKLLES